MKKYYRVLLEDNLEMPTEIDILKECDSRDKYNRYFDDFDSLEKAEKAIEEILINLNNEYSNNIEFVIINVYKKG